MIGSLPRHRVAGFLYEAGTVAAKTELRFIGSAWFLLGSSGIGGRSRARRTLRDVVAAGIGDAEVVLGVLVEVLCGDRVAADRSLAREGNVALEELMRAAANSDAGTVAVEGLAALRRSLLLWLEGPVGVIGSARPPI